MHFISSQYVALLLGTVVLYWLLPWRRVRLVLLLVASNVFYMSWSEKLVVLLWFSTLLDFVCGMQIGNAPETGRTRRFWLLVSLVGNVGVLGAFKYFDFFYDSTVVLVQSMGFQAHPRTLQIVLPLGISFYTFQSMSYTIDIYRKHLRPTTSVLEFAVFIAFFPQLVAGPIVRARDFLPQAAYHHRLNSADVMQGIDQIVWGMVKKAVIADNIAQVCDFIFAHAAGTTSTHAWMGVIAFYGQVYCDFSGYTDIAIGSARLFGYRIKANFLRPYLTTSPQQYWNHWHISLSTWLRDYVYFPLGGNRRGPVRTYVNLFITMMVSGLWHGAAWTFVIWGAYHGVCLMVHRAWSRAGHALPHWAGLFGQVAFTCVGYFMFRAESWHNMVDMMTAAAALPTTLPNVNELGVLAWCAFVFGLEPVGHRLVDGGLYRRHPWVRPVVWGLGFTAILALAPPEPATFVYFVF